MGKRRARQPAINLSETSTISVPASLPNSGSLKVSDPAALTANTPKPVESAQKPTPPDPAIAAKIEQKLPKVDTTPVNLRQVEQKEDNRNPEPQLDLRMEPDPDAPTPAEPLSKQPSATEKPEAPVSQIKPAEPAEAKRGPDAIAPNAARKSVEAPKMPEPVSPRETLPEPAREPAPISKDRATPFGAEIKPPESAPVPESKGPAELPEPHPAPEPNEDEIVESLPRIEQPKQKVEAPVEHAPAHVTAPRPAIGPMYVVQITPELDPVAKVGGLADVVYGLSRELEIRGNSVEIILPKYDCMRYDQIYGLTRSYENLSVPWYGGAIPCTVWFGFVHGRKCYFIEPNSKENFFNRSCIYGHNDDVSRFAFFCRAALEFMLKTGKHPEIIHCHDWQTALVPVLLFEMYKFLGMSHPRVCFTIHNFRHQGVCGEYVLRATGLNRPEYYFSYDRMRDNYNPNVLNLTKGGIVFSNFVTTVSPRHAWEAKDAGQGHGLEPTLHAHHYKYGGILNGLDYEMYGPETDRYIAAQYSARDIEKKYENKRALRQRFWLKDGTKPIVAFIGRLDPQKGLDLVRHGIFYSLGQQAQFVLLGSSPDHSINEHFWGLKRHLNDSPDCHLEIGFNNELAHLIYAGADMMLVPSRFEPCGLTQLISLRYGTVPIVRSVGGLADTVFDKDYSNRPLHERNGYVFHQAENSGLESALHRAIRCYYDFPRDFRNLMLNGMRCDNSWNQPGQHYLEVYEHIRAK